MKAGGWIWIWMPDLLSYPYLHPTDSIATLQGCDDHSTIAPRRRQARTHVSVHGFRDCVPSTNAIIDQVACSIQRMVRTTMCALSHQDPGLFHHMSDTGNYNFFLSARFSGLPVRPGILAGFRQHKVSNLLTDEYCPRASMDESH